MTHESAITSLMQHPPIPSDKPDPERINIRAGIRSLSTLAPDTLLAVIEELADRLGYGFSDTFEMSRTSWDIAHDMGKFGEEAASYDDFDLDRFNIASDMLHDARKRVSKALEGEG